MPIYGRERDVFVKTIERRGRLARGLHYVRQMTVGSDKTTQAALYDAMFRNDREAVAYPYAKANDHMPDLDDPLWINEKIRWQFLNHPNPLISLCSDKIAVRDYLSWKGAEVLPPRLIATGSTPEELAAIDLPDRFVLKSTFGSGQNHIESGKGGPTPVADLAGKVARWNAWDFWRKNAELHYRDIPKRWLVEEFVPASGEKLEFKIFCICGEPQFIAVITERGRDGEAGLDGVRHALFDLNWNRIEIGMQGVGDDPNSVPRPNELGQLISEARRLAEGFLHVRVDYLKFDGRLTFSELTFSSLGARLPFTPVRVNEELGEKMDLRKAPEYLARGEHAAGRLHARLAA